MDQHLSLTQLSQPQQPNCVCDTLTKQAVTTTIVKGYHNGPAQILPREDVALIVWGDKITGDILGPLKFYASKLVARKYLTHQRKKN
jgi:hypothetical protein